MKKRLFFTVLSAVVVLTLTSLPAFSYMYTIENYAATGTYTYANSGAYLGTVIEANDNTTNIEGVLAQLGYNVDIVTSSKVEAPNTSSPTGSDFTLYITYADGSDEKGYNSGTWATFPSLLPPPSGAALVDYYVVKGAHEFALYLVNPAAIQGTWNVGNLRTPNGKKNPAISHFSGYDPPISSTSVVPEPSVLLLLGFGLVGLIGAGRKVKK